MKHKTLHKFFVNNIVVLLLLTSFSFVAKSQQTARDFSKENARASRDWVKDAVIYEIFPRQYSQKGDFNAITNDLDRLKNLGVTVLWLMPIHPIGREKAKGTIGSPYAVKDFYAINPDYGTKADLQKLISEAHTRQMKVIIDIVANHTAWDSVMMKNKSFYTQDKSGNIIPPVADWKDVADLNYVNAELRKYMIEMLKAWIRDYDLDGFRCDVAGFVPTDFWETARAEVDKIKPDTIWLAEWESPDLLVKAFDLDYSWANHSAMMNVLQGNVPASEIRKVWEADRAKMPKGALRMRFSDNHDERRAIARFGEKAALAAQALVFTLDGVPMFYNGMEAGDTTESGAPALFEKLPIFWQIAERRPEFPRFYKEMIQLRKNSAALRRGDLTWLKNSDENRVLTFTRQSGNEEILTAINFSNQPFFGAVELSGNYDEITPNIGAPMPPDDDKMKAKSQSKVGLPTLNLEAFGFRIFKKRN
ncbi:MAG: alpha-amylase family glycosyl hydrolase [Acidobacteriota bacterium]|nr:alpha-amylase family glycosyl hydrolase [Acidobacteriota bacterium]